MFDTSEIYLLIEHVVEKYLKESCWFGWYYPFQCWGYFRPKHKDAKFFEKHFNPVMLVFIGLISLSTHVPGFRSFLRSFEMAKLATSSLRVNPFKTKVSIGNSLDVWYFWNLLVNRVCCWQIFEGKLLVLVWLILLIQTFCKWCFQMNISPNMEIQLMCWSNCSKQNHISKDLDKTADPFWVIIWYLAIWVKRLWLKYVTYLKLSIFKNGANLTGTWLKLRTPGYK